MYKDRAVTRLLPPESAALEVVSREIGVGAGTLQRWRDEAQAKPARGPGGPGGRRVRGWRRW